MEIEKLKEQLLSDPDVRRMIAHRAHEIYLERRGYRDAHPAEDWLNAESEIIPRLMNEMLERNRRAIESHDASDPVMREAADHMQQELGREETDPGEPTTAAKAAGRELLEQNAEALASVRDEGEATVPNARGVLSGEATVPAKKKPAAKKAPAKTAAKPAAKKASAAKAPVKATAKKPAAKKAEATKAPAKPAAKPAAKKPAAKPRLTES